MPASRAPVRETQGAPGVNPLADGDGVVAVDKLTGTLYGEKDDGTYVAAGGGGGAPSGPAGGDLAGTYPNPDIGTGVIVNADVNASAAIAESKLSLASDAAAGTASRRTLGTSATSAAAGDTSPAGLLTTLGDIIRRGASTPERLAVGSNGQVLTVVTGEPAWAAAGGGSVPAWTSYTPTWTNGGSIGNGTLAAAYYLNGKELHIRLTFKAGSTTTFGGAGWTFSLPGGVTAISAGNVRQILPVWLFDSSTTTQYVANTRVDSANVFSINAGGTVDVGSTTPFTWATSDEIQLTGLLEVT